MQSLSIFKKRILDIYTRNTKSYVLPASGVRVVLMCLFIGRVQRRLRLGAPLFMVFHLVLGAKYQLGHCPVSCSSCNIYLFYFVFLYLTRLFYIFIMYILTDNMHAMNSIKVKVNVKKL